jgi:hypothetical protein
LPLVRKADSLIEKEILSGEVSKEASVFGCHALPASSIQYPVSSFIQGG